MVGSTVLLALLGLGFGLVLLDWNSDEEDGASGSDDDFLVSGNDTLAGTDEADSFLRDPDATDFDNVSIDAGAGDDTLPLYDPEADGDSLDLPEFGNASINAGDGDDVVSVAVAGSTVSGGDGSDTISVHVRDSLINGDDGDDVIGVHNAGGTSVFQGGNGDDLIIVNDYVNGARFYGGEGNDTIDASLPDFDFESGVLDGGDGDDLIRLGVIGDESGAGYAVQPNGGAGNDTISVTGDVAGFAINDSSMLTGGTGADSFEISLSEGANEFSLASLHPLSPSVDGTTRVGIVNIGDFEPGVDKLEIDASVDDPSFSVTNARLEMFEDEDGNAASRLVLRYESETGQDRDAVINFGPVLVTWGDITFTGEVPLTLG